MKNGLRNLVATVLVFCAVGLFSLALGTTGGTGGTESGNQQTPTPTATPTPSPSPSVTPTPVPEPEPAPTATATPQLRGRQQL
jgi:hypothetical protein